MRLIEEGPPPFDFTPPELTEEDRPEQFTEEHDPPEQTDARGTQHSAAAVPDTTPAGSEQTDTQQPDTVAAGDSEDFGAGLEVASTPPDSEQVITGDAVDTHTGSPPVTGGESSAERDTGDDSPAKDKPKRRRRSRRGRRKNRGGPSQSQDGGESTPR